MSSLLEVRDLRTYFFTRSGVNRSVDGLTFKVHRGETLGIVGESGSGKSVSMLSLLGLIPTPPGKIVSGTALFAGKDLLKMSPKALRSHRGCRIAMIFQDSMTALNPYLKISSQLEEVLTTHKGVNTKIARKRAIESMEMVGIPQASQRIHDYPHQFSGGMRQRVLIAMALMAKPDLIIADEPTTALDVTVQAQILGVLKDLQRDLGMGMVLITHDLGVVAGMCDRVLVMYAGKLVEEGWVEQMFNSAHHPYTRGLLQSVPRLTNDDQRLLGIPGSPPDPSQVISGCSFSPRCQYAMECCSKSLPIPRRSAERGHQSYCHLESPYGS